MDKRYVTYPEQGAFNGKRAEVLLTYDTSQPFYGTIIRDDRDEPFRTIIHLDDGRVLLSTECQWRPL